MNAADKNLEKKKEREFTLNELRFIQFERLINKASFKLQSLPPTEAAAREHCKRCYLQVQIWLGNHLDPVKYGWQRTEIGLQPVKSEEQPIPPEVAEKISCKCQKGCKASCSCRKHGLNCSRLCANCNGDGCTNAPMVDLDLFEDDVPENLMYCEDENLNEPAPKKQKLI